MKKIKLFCLLCLLIAGLVFPELTGRGALQAQNNDRQLVATTPLQPEPGTQVLVPNFQLEKYSDESVTIISEGERTIGSGTLLYDFQVDINNGTYKTLVIGP